MPAKRKSGSGRWKRKTYILKGSRKGGKPRIKKVYKKLPK